MGVQATFAADFSSFVQAAEKATISLKNIDDGAGGVEKSLTRMANSLSGTSMIQQATLMAEAVDRVGGVSTLTEKELARVGTVAQEAAAKLTALGQDVPPGIQKIVDATHDASKAWGDFVSGFDIKTAISDPIGVAKDGVQALASTLGPAGIAAVAAAGAFTAVGGAILTLAENAADVGGNLNDMAEKTGLSVPALSKLSNASQVAGGNLDQMASALFLFERNLGEGSQKFQEGLQRIGLSTEQIKAAGPDQYLSIIAGKLGALTDPSERAAAAMELFGRQGRDIIPTLLKLDQGLAATNDIQPWTEQQAKDAETFNLQIDSMKVHAEAFATSIGRDLIGPLSSVASTGPSALSSLVYIAGELTQIGPAIRDMGEAWSYAAAAKAAFFGSKVEIPKIIGADEAAASLKKMSDAAYDAAHSPDALAKAWKAANLSGVIKPVTDGLTQESSLIAASNAAIKEHAAEVKAAAAEEKKAAEEYAKALDAQIRAVESTDQLKFKTLSLAEAFKAIGPASPAPAITDLSGIVLQSASDIQGLNGSIDDLQRHGDFMSASIQKAGAQIGILPNVTAQATKAIKEAGEQSDISIGREMAQDFKDVIQLVDLIPGKLGDVASIAVQTGENFSKALARGDTFGEITALAAGAVKEIKTLFGGVSQDEKDARTEAGSFATSLDALLTKTEKLEAGGVQWKETNIAVRDAYLAVGLSQADALAAIDKLNAATHENADAVKAAEQEINDVLNEQKQDQADLQAAVEKYGFTIDQLGPTMKKQQLDDQAESIENDFRLLVGSGIDVNTVLDKMSGSVNQFVDDAIATGVEVPAAMKPMLEKMEQQGELTDANGNKITDLTAAGVTFAETMSDAADRIVKGFNDILVKIGLIPAAANAAATAISNIPSPADYGGSDSGGGAEPVSTGGLVTRYGIQHFSGGGKVLPFSPFGSDTVPAMLTPGEMVLNASQQRALLGGGGGDINVTIVSQMDGVEVGRQVTKIQSRDLQSRRKLAAA